MITTVTTILCDMPHEGDYEGETIRFALDGKDYEIDLCHADRQELALAFANWASAGRRLLTPGQPGHTPKPRRTQADRKRAADIRAWARMQGLSVPDKGRIPDDVIRGYDERPAYQS